MIALLILAQSGSWAAVWKVICKTRYPLPFSLETVQMTRRCRNRPPWMFRTCGEALRKVTFSLVCTENKRNKQEFQLKLKAEILFLFVFFFKYKIDIMSTVFKTVPQRYEYNIYKLSCCGQGYYCLIKLKLFLLIEIKYNICLNIK